MSRNFSLLAATLGLVSQRYRTLGQWVETYREIIEARPLSYKTKAMTDIYNDDRGLSKGQWKTLKLIDQPLGVN